PTTRSSGTTERTFAGITTSGHLGARRVRLGLVPHRCLRGGPPRRPPVGPATDDLVEDGCEEDAEQRDPDHAREDGDAEREPLLGAGTGGAHERQHAEE